MKKQVRNFFNASQLNKKSFSDGFFLDLRSLALFRIGIGLVLIANLIVRLAMPNYLPIEDGVLPAELMNFGGSCPWSFHFFWHSLWYQNLLICLNLILCFCYLIGHKTRCVAPLVFLFQLFYQPRYATTVAAQAPPGHEWPYTAQDLVQPELYFGRSALGWY